MKMTETESVAMLTQNVFKDCYLILDLHSIVIMSEPYAIARIGLGLLLSCKRDNATSCYLM